MSSLAKESAVDLAAELRPSILRLSRHLRREANQSGNSSLDLQILKALHENRGSTVAELAAAEQMTRPAMSEHIKRLVLRGYVKRAQARSDEAGSPIDLSLTRSGKRYLDGISRRNTEWLTLRLEQLSASERSALDRATRSLRSILESSEHSI